MFGNGTVPEVIAYTILILFGGYLAMFLIAVFFTLASGGYSRDIQRVISLFLFRKPPPE